MQKRRGGPIKVHAHSSNELTRTTLVQNFSTKTRSGQTQGQDKPLIQNLLSWIIISKVQKLLLSQE